MEDIRPHNYEYIYSTSTKWGLKRFTCDVCFYRVELLDDLSFVICSILNENGGEYEYQSLGVLLGFCVCNQDLGGENPIYYDAAERKLYSDILGIAEERKLVSLSDGIVKLTNLGKISIETGLLYSFFKGTKDLYEHLNIKSDLPLALQMFPFYEDMGIFTTIKSAASYWPDDNEVGDIINFKITPLLKRLSYQSKESDKIYYASIQDFYEIETVKIPVKLFLADGTYIPVIYNGDKAAVKATRLVSNGLNEEKRENIILECLFQKLWDDRNATFSYDNLSKFEELIDFDKLTMDSRVIWTDSRLIDMIIRHANPNSWRNICRYCDISVLYGLIPDYAENLDWIILSERVGDEFLLNGDNFQKFPWDLEVISNDQSRSIKTIEKLLLTAKDSSDEWDWFALEMRLEETFVFEHLDFIDINLSKFTKNIESVKEAIIVYPNKRWDYNVVVSDFDLDYILENITILGSYLPYDNLFKRIFNDIETQRLFIENIEFKNIILKESEIGSLSSTILNNSDFKWTIDLIKFLTETGLIVWETTPYEKGFECSDFIKWDHLHFDTFSNNIITQEGKSYVSGRIDDVAIITDNPNWDWDWLAISSNPNLLGQEDLYTKFGHRLNWSEVLKHDIDIYFLQNSPKIAELLNTDVDAWTLFSSLADVDFILKNYRYSWDWSVLTKRIFHKLKLQNLGNKDFIDKWDWKFLSDSVELSFLMDNLDKYKQYWEWSIVIPRIIPQDKKFDYSLLDGIAIILTNIFGKEKCEQAWHEMTAYYSFDELKKVISDTINKRAYWWDIKYFCQHPKFNIFVDLKSCASFMDWDAFSSSESVDRALLYNPSRKIKQQVWIEKIKELLDNPKYRWNFKLLSKFNSLNSAKWFISKFRDRLDWNVISAESNIFTTDDKQELSNIITKYKNYIDFGSLSKRSDVDVPQIIKIYPSGDYDFNDLLRRHIIQPSTKLFDSRDDYDWDWFEVTTFGDFRPSARFILERLDKELNWNVLSSNDNKQLWGSLEVISEIASDSNLQDAINWSFVTGLPYFPIVKEILELLIDLPLNWRAISKRKEIIPLIEDFKDFVDWEEISASVFFPVDNIKLLKAFGAKLNWTIICNRPDFIIDNIILDEFADFIDWNKASTSLSIKFDEHLVKRYHDRWNWPALARNKAFTNRVDLSLFPYVSQHNIITFVERFPCRPRAYHFTHLSNAVEIIRSMKLQSRDAANGKFANSAGTNVDRTAKAHRFARFYFAPKSPTQFYNEFLGKDKESKYYIRAFGLGLPKCPLPVFFVVDVEELLMLMPELCYYSNGNMQKDASRFFKVISDPSQIKAREIYINSKETFNERQQEFLIDKELDLSKLSFIRICCYDDFQAEILRREVFGSPLESKIVVDRSLYEYENKRLIFQETEDILYITTQYSNDFEFKITYQNLPPTIINKDKILRQRGKSIFLADSVNISKSTEFDVFFEVTSPRIGSWLIYSNKKS